MIIPLSSENELNGMASPGTLSGTGGLASID